MSGTVIVIIVAILVVMTLVFLFLITGITGAPYVPSKKEDIRRAFTKLHKISAKDLVVDLGAGDGVVLMTATELGAKAVGVELNPIMALITRWRVRNYDGTKIKCGDMYRFDFPAETTVVYAYANNFTIPNLHRKVQKEADRLDKTLYLISNAFDLKDIKPTKNLEPYYLYTITPSSK